MVRAAVEADVSPVDAIAEAADRPQQRGVLAQLGPDLGHVLIDGPGLAGGSEAPGPLEQRITRDDAAGVDDEVVQQRELALGQR